MTTSRGTKFDIITTEDEIIFLDENGETLTWSNTEYNSDLVSELVKAVTGNE